VAAFSATGERAVLITGAAGFIGSHLVRRYLSDGWRVVGVDNFLTGSASNLSGCPAGGAFTFVEADVSGSWEAVFDACAGAALQPGLILHFASPASPIDYAMRPLETLAVNSVGTKRCLDAALAWQARLLFASTSESYGDPKEHPQRESYWGNVNPVGPRSCYDESKRFGEALVTSFQRVNGIDARIIRIFNTYGPRMRLDDGRVVPNFVGQALAGLPLSIFGDGSQTRSFCFVDDLVEGIVRCAASDHTRGLVVNLGNPEEYSIKAFAEIVCEIVGVPLHIASAPLPVDDPGRRCPDISRARELLGWEPVISVREGLRATLDDFRARAG
jgi:nucleoside-diphosphate-sugar epimerase